MFRADDWSIANNASNHWPTKFRAPDPLTDSLCFRLYVTSSKKLRTWNDATVQPCLTPCSELTLIGSGKVFPIYFTYLTVQGKQIRPWWPLRYNAMWQLWISQLRHGFVSDAEFSGRYSTAQRLTFWYAQTCAYTCHIWSIKSKQKTYCSFCTYAYIHTIFAYRYKIQGLITVHSVYQTHNMTLLLKHRYVFLFRQWCYRV